MRLIYCFYFYFITLFTLPHSISAQIIKGKVISVKDGDTIEILQNGKVIKIRFYGIDCPEKGQDFGAKAKEFTSKMCYGKMVEIVSHGKDKYRRLLGDVILPDKTNLNLWLVQAGYAWRYKYSHDQQLKKLEIEAKTHHRGLWINENATPPWEFRNVKKKKTQVKLNQHT